MRALHREFCSKNESNISMGTFLGLRPFYVRSPNAKDIEMCQHKGHLCDEIRQIYYHRVMKLKLSRCSTLRR